MVEEIREQRKLVQERTEGHVFRYAMRFYRVPNAGVAAAMRVFDGPTQGFFLIANGTRTPSDAKSWADMRPVSVKPPP